MVTKGKMPSILPLFSITMESLKFLFKKSKVKCQVLISFSGLNVGINQKRLEPKGS